ncbi:uncharacterized protein ARMOST_19046 [Armillaria ostoyae]|uniref:Retrotransposon gag domain-containing protein n=1 Tax=Armillaria ostoyae TaxID=47428 RepID=A0A284S3G2_ARMOS|nr:uncharacterized protein ARMOST_19046 [Armillaria ostoyae]
MTQWTGTSLSIGGIQLNELDTRPASPRESLPIETGWYTLLQPGSQWSDYDHKWSMNSGPWSNSYLSWHDERETASTWMDEMIFDRFDDDGRDYGGTMSTFPDPSQIPPPTPESDNTANTMAQRPVTSMREVTMQELVEVMTSSTTKQRQGQSPRSWTTAPAVTPEPLPTPLEEGRPIFGPSTTIRLRTTTTAPPTSRLPKVFKGEHEDIKRFFGDCIMYFKMFSSYFLLPSQMIPFAASLFDGLAKKWWVHKCQELWSDSAVDTVPTQFQYPTWTEFVNMVNIQFWDPAVEEVHEKKMFDLRMGNGPATHYFQELETQAMLAGLHNNERKRGMMV